MQLIKQDHPHHLEHDVSVALVAGPLVLVALAIMAIVLQDAPVLNAAHATIVGR
jgi:hypothetical protein